MKINAEVPCPHCRKLISIDAKKCPYCQSDISMHNLALREPRAFKYGILGGIVGILTGMAIHSKFLMDFVELVKKLEGCSVCLIPCLHGPLGILLIFMLMLYGAAGFIVGFLVAELSKS